MDNQLGAISHTRPSNKNICLAVVIGAIIGIIAFAPVWLHHGGQYMDYGDYFLQYVPFIKELKRMVRSGSLSWSWNSFLGDGFVGAYSYYTAFNPFAWIVAAFPDKYILYGTMFATILKLSISMVAAMLYMRRFCKKDSYALIGALLYTFSGFTLINTNFYFFLDVIAVFPLLIYGLELLICEGKSTIYVLSLVLNAAINYYFFVSTVFLVVIYVVFRLELYKISSWKLRWKQFFSIAVYSIIGIGMAGIALTTSFFAILGSGKATETIGTSIEWMFYPQEILEHIRTLVAPIESGRYHAFFDSSTCSSTGVYLPVFGFICVLQWCIRKNDWLKKVSITLLICYFVPVLNAAFNLFSSTFYTRWLYGMALIFSLVTVMTLEESEQATQLISSKLLFAVTLFTTGLLGVPTVIYFLYQSGISFVNRFASACTPESFMGYFAIVSMLLLTAANYIALWYCVCRKKRSIRLMVIIVTAMCTINFGVYNALNYDLHPTAYSNNYYYSKALVEGNEHVKNGFEYRIDYPGQIANWGLFKNMPSVNYYNSLQNHGSSRFAEAVGIGNNLRDTVLLTPDKDSEYTNALLSVKYYYDYDGNSVIPSGFNYLKNDNGVDIYENKNYIPMGITYENYILADKLTDMEPSERAKNMLRALVVQKNDEETVKKYISASSDIAAVTSFDEIVSERNKSVCSYFMGTSDGFTAEIDLEKENIVFFSIPNDNGWEITVNGEPANIIDANYGLLGICCNEGTNVISATYHAQGLIMGCILSMAALAAWLVIELYDKRIRTKKEVNAIANHST